MNIQDLEDEVYGNLDRTCLGVPYTEFFPTNNPAGPSVNAAKAICGWCPVRKECLLLGVALAAEGIWGGTTLVERRKHHGQRSMLPDETADGRWHQRRSVDRAAIVAARTAQGASVAAIAEELGIGERAVGRYRSAQRRERVAA